MKQLTKLELERVTTEVYNELAETFEGVKVNVIDNGNNTINIDMEFEGKERNVVKDLDQSLDTIIKELLYTVYTYTTEEIDDYSDDYDEDEIRRVNELNEWNNDCN